MSKTLCGFLTILLNLVVLIAVWSCGTVSRPTPSALSTPIPPTTSIQLTPTVRSNVIPEQTKPGQSSDKVEQQCSPNGQWTAIVNQTKGSLDLYDGRQNYSIFPEGSTVQQVTWSPDSSRLLIVRTNWLPVESRQGLQANSPVEIWQLSFEHNKMTPPALLFRPGDADQQQIVFGQWSPNSRYIVFWTGILSASILADGLPPSVLDVETGEVYPIVVASSANVTDLSLSPQSTALVNPRYHSWSPDSSMLAITVGGYRSAQINKWLDLFEVASGQVTVVISKTQQIPGIVAWSPQGDLIAYAAVPAEQTSDEWADLMTFDNPAIVGRRIYLLDPTTGQYRRLNNIEVYQDAPVWDNEGNRLYYVQRDGDYLQLMIANPVSGQAKPVPHARQPIELNDPYRPEAGYYGQFERDELLIPALEKTQ